MNRVNFRSSSLLKKQQKTGFSRVKYQGFVKSWLFEASVGLLKGNCIFTVFKHKSWSRKKVNNFLYDSLDLPLDSAKLGISLCTVFIGDFERGLFPTKKIEFALTDAEELKPSRRTLIY